MWDNGDMMPNTYGVHSLIVFMVSLESYEFRIKQLNFHVYQENSFPRSLFRCHLRVLELGESVFMCNDMECQARPVWPALCGWLVVDDSVKSNSNLRDSLLLGTKCTTSMHALAANRCRCSFQVKQGVFNSKAWKRKCHMSGPDLQSETLCVYWY